MTDGDKYKAFRNFMFNELGITKLDIRTWVLEAVREQVKTIELDQRIENAVSSEIHNNVRQAVRNTLNISSYNRSSPMVDRIVADILKDRVTISMKDDV